MRTMLFAGTIYNLDKLIEVYEVTTDYEDETYAESVRFRFEHDFVFDEPEIDSYSIDLLFNRNAMYNIYDPQTIEKVVKDFMKMLNDALNNTIITCIDVWELRDRAYEMNRVKISGK